MPKSPRNVLQGNSEYAIQFSFAETVVGLGYSSEIFNIVLFMVSCILITGYSILLFMKPLNFKFLQVPVVLFYTFLCQRFF